MYKKRQKEHSSNHDQKDNITNAIMPLDQLFWHKYFSFLEKNLEEELKIIV